MEAFWDLCSDRYQVGQRIPWVARQGWAVAHGIDELEEQSDFHFLVSKLDVTFLQWLNKKTPKTRPHQTPEKTNDERRGVRTSNG